ncbi:MAG: sensor histidine kinase [Candidatus Onthomorpha sp.]
MKYSLKNPKLKWVFLIVGFVIIFVFFVEINQIIVQLQQEEQKKIELWANAVSRRARFVEHTTEFFNKAAQEEQLRLQQFVKAHQIILSQPLDAELNFYYDFIVNNKNIPVIITDEFNNIQLSQNIDIPEGQKVLVGSLLKRFSKNPPFEYNVSGMKFKLYYSESSVYTNLKETLKYFTTTFLEDLVNNSVLIPVVITDSTESIVIASGNIAKKDIQGDKLKSTIGEMKDENDVWTISLPEFPNARIFYKHSHLITALQYYPVIFILITIFFVFLVFRLFKAMKKTEETTLWIGMNKETAHQLGTPISALVAWVEYLRLKPENEEVCNEITKDINRLNMITQRFSQIGTNPELLPQNIIPVVQNAMAYLSSRSSKKVNFVLNLPQDTDIVLPINQCLIEWTLENLSKNAIDAMGGIGTLTLDLTEDTKRVFIDVSDTGKGMPKKQFKKVFEAGFTTKERGWGMGLSLAKRIIEEYHHGKIFVKQSTLNKGTTFRIVLKKEE